MVGEGGKDTEKEGGRERERFHEIEESEILRAGGSVGEVADNY